MTETNTLQNKIPMKNTKQKSIGDEIVEQIHMTGTTFTIRMVEDYDGQPTIVLKDNDCGDMAIIQTIGNEIKVTHIDTNEIVAIKAVL